MSGAYPPGCTQAMHDRAFADEDRGKCDRCDGTGEIPAAPIYCHLYEIGVAERSVECPDCQGTGYEPNADSREDDAYEQSREDEDHDC